jgi:hypothetical protein
MSRIKIDKKIVKYHVQKPEPEPEPEAEKPAAREAREAKVRK